MLQVLELPNGSNRQRWLKLLKRLVMPSSDASVRRAKKAGYPPDMQDAAMELVPQQAQALGESWA